VDGKAVGARGGVSPGLGDGVDAFADLADARGGPLHFGDDRETTGDRERLTEARRVMPAGEGRQLGVGDGTGERGDLPALGIHDFGQLVHWA